jgi:flap endonuclease-1
MEEGLRLIFVFDGKPNVLKKTEIERRQEVRQLAQKQFENAQDEESSADMKKFGSATGRLTSEMIAESKELLTAFGLPIVQAIEDGEAQAAYMIQKDHAFACGSQDYDAFLFGATRIVRNLSASQTHKVHNQVEKTPIEFYNLDKILEYLRVTRPQLVDMGLLIGVDFFEGVKGIGGKTAYDLITKHGNIETVMRETGDKYQFGKLTESDFLETIRGIFLKPKVFDVTPSEIQFKKIDDVKIREILVEKHNFDPVRVNNLLERFWKVQSNAKQGSLDLFTKKK